MAFQTRRWFVHAVLAGALAATACNAIVGNESGSSREEGTTSSSSSTSSSGVFASSSGASGVAVDASSSSSGGDAAGASSSGNAPCVDCVNAVATVSISGSYVVAWTQGNTLQAKELSSGTHVVQALGVEGHALAFIPGGGPLQPPQLAVGYAGHVQTCKMNATTFEISCEQDYADPAITDLQALVWHAKGQRIFASTPTSLRSIVDATAVPVTNPDWQPPFGALAASPTRLFARTNDGIRVLGLWSPTPMFESRVIQPGVGGTVVALAVRETPDETTLYVAKQHTNTTFDIVAIEPTAESAELRAVVIDQVGTVVALALGPGGLYWSRRDAGIESGTFVRDLGDNAMPSKIDDAVAVSFAASNTVMFYATGTATNGPSEHDPSNR